MATRLLSLEQEKSPRKHFEKNKHSRDVKQRAIGSPQEGIACRIRSIQILHPATLGGQSVETLGTKCNTKNAIFNTCVM